MADILIKGQTPAEQAAALAPNWRLDYYCNVCKYEIQATVNDIYATPVDYLSTYTPGSRVADRLYRYSTICPVCSTKHWTVEVPKPIVDYVAGIIPPIEIQGHPLVVTGTPPTYLVADTATGTSLVAV